MVKLYRLEDVFGLSGSHSAELVSAPVEITYLRSLVDTVKESKDINRVLAELEKAHQAAIMHGYRGHSSGRKNGIVDITPTDRHLLDDFDRLLNSNKWYFKAVGAVLQSLKHVKFVAHIKNGNRLVAAMDTSQKPYKVYVLGLSNYSGKIA